MAEQLYLDFDTDISKGKDNAVSKDMNIVNLKSRYTDTDRVLELINGQRSTYEIAEIMEKLINKISGRFSQLKQANTIYPITTKTHGLSKFTVYNKI